MSAIEMVIEKVKQLDEQHARQVLNWLQGQESAPTPARQPAGAMAMLGFARKFRTAPRATADWIELWFRDIKTSMGMEALRCKSPQTAQKELEMFFIAYNLIRVVMAQASATYHVPMEL